MPSIVYNAHNGFCVDNSLTAKRNPEKIFTNGLDRLPWAEVLGEPPASEENDKEKEASIEDSVENVDKKKLSKSEKKELKHQKKINAARAKQLKRQKALAQVMDESDPRVFNEFLAIGDIKRIRAQIVDKCAKHNGSENESRRADFKLLQYHSVALYRSDLDHMLPGEWLNDNNISFVYEVMTQSFLGNANAFGHQIQVLYPSLVQLFMHFPASDDIESILPIDELKKSKFIFVPLNFIDDFDDVDLESSNNGDHWALGLLSVLENRFYVYDSMAIDQDEDSEQLVKEVVRRFSSCKSIVKGNRPLEVMRMKCDQQQNFDDCGVFVVMITCYLVNQLLCGSDDGVSLDISGVSFNALSGRLQMMQLVQMVLNQKAS